MKPDSRVLMVQAMLLACCLALWGCPKKSGMSSSQVVPSDDAAAADSAASSTEVTEWHPENDVEAGSEAEGAGSERADESARSAGRAAAGLQPIFFDFDQSSIRADSLSVMRENAAWLKANPGKKIKIAGNSDERGTKEYNIALGQRRAANAKKYLTDMGVSGQRISLISFGKEKPVCMNSSEECWQKNRRDDFIVISR